jgi:hypothetical protein
VVVVRAITKAGDPAAATAELAAARQPTGSGRGSRLMPDFVIELMQAPWPSSASSCARRGRVAAVRP